MRAKRRAVKPAHAFPAALAFLPLLAAWNPLERPNRSVADGNASLQKGKAEEALARYDQAAAALPADPAVHFNRGTALFALSRYDEAIAELMRATESKSPSLKAAAFYNLGNSYFKADRYADAIAAYKHSLGLEPGDMHAKWNLELALQKKQEEDKKKQEQQDKDKDKDNKKQDDQKKRDDQKKQDQDKKQDEKKQEPDAGAPKQEPPKPPQGQDAGAQPPQEQPAAQPKDDKAPEMSEIDAVLDSLERSPKDLEKMRARLRAVRRAPPAKDW
ncbi:MAG: tetratricopeptide repeat protein [Polyangia bacterium]|jgi:Ca-activated chloride channel family protein